MKRTPKAKASQPDAALNIRNFPEELRWLCRERANQARKSLREYVIDSLRQATREGAEALERENREAFSQAFGKEDA